ncbi:hypothetical protein, partial [Klebsiella aerogenes]|uniref:hypothetical protein n=1 Tax=Klebsiella aerogenes TaxID=548 RepID=UPI0019531114
AKRHVRKYQHPTVKPTCNTGGYPIANIVERESLPFRINPVQRPIDGRISEGARIDIQPNTTLGAVKAKDIVTTPHS